MHFHQVHTSSAAVLSAWRGQYQANQWSRFGRWERQGSLGCAYWFPKAKNTAKSRVIVSCVRHPLTHVLCRAGRALKSSHPLQAAGGSAKSPGYKPLCNGGVILVA
jgi:hypothetical protein